MIVSVDRRRFVLTVDADIKQRLANLVAGMKITLASGSPRRREILTLAGLKFNVVVPNVTEHFSSRLTPRDYALEIAHAKLNHVPSSDSLTVAADTIVVLDEKILGKPNDEVDAERVLRLLAGRRHYVVTALAVREPSSGKIISDAEISFVTFRELVDEDIIDYVRSGEPMDKAGAYGIQGMGEFLVEKLEGDLLNVIGFPLRLFVRMVEELKSGL